MKVCFYDKWSMFAFYNFCGNDDIFKIIIELK